MPDATGHLSPVEIRAVIDWLTLQHGSLYVCPVSRHTEWAVNEYVYQQTIYPIQGPTAAHVVSPLPWPVVQLACSGCGYTMFMNAGLMGLFPAPPPTPPLPLAR